MRICHVTPHLPPDQAANALLPFHLGTWARDAGDAVTYLAHPPRAGGPPPALPGDVTWIPRRPEGTGLARLLRVDSAVAAAAIVRRARPVLADADLVHVHSNGLLAEVTALLAVRMGLPVVLTLYGTEIWHYDARRPRPDLFTRVYRRASHVTFYSHGLHARAIALGLARREASVVYPPVAPEFVWTLSDEARAEARDALGIRNRHLIVNVKRLHPLAGQRFLIEALGEVIRTHPDTRLVICGTGPLAAELRQVAETAGVTAHVTFAGLVDNATIARYDAAADVFALPSLLEACPTVALEALACGTPVVSSDNPGGVELSDLFGLDVAVVPREDPLALARAIIDALDARRRARPSTVRLIEEQFRPAAVDQRFRAIYQSVLEAAGQAAAS